jgi:hypothetical protein
MNRERARTRWAVTGFAVFAGILIVGAGSPPAARAYEVWATDQSDTAKESGGVLYIYDGQQLATNPAAARPAATIDFGKEIGAYCQEKTGRAVRRPHMLQFTKDQRYAILSFLSGQVLFMDAESRKPLGCVSVGKHVHAAFPTPDQKMVVVAGEKKFVRVWTDYASEKFSFEPDKDVIDLGAMESGDLPDNAPICPVTDASGKYAFITLKGGGLVVAAVTETPMKIAATTSSKQIRPAGCGGAQVGQTMYINSGGGTPAAPLTYDVYAVDMRELPKAISVKLVLSRDGEFADSHGLVVMGKHLWSGDRAGNRIDVIDTATNRHVGTINLAGPASDDPAPDLMDASPDGTHVFMSLRGPVPLSGNHPEKMNAKGSTPGVGVVKVTDDAKSGTFLGVSRIANVKDGKETADPHAIAVRKAGSHSQPNGQSPSQPESHPHSH